MRFVTCMGKGMDRMNVSKWVITFELCWGMVQRHMCGRRISGVSVWGC